MYNRKLLIAEKPSLRRKIEAVYNRHRNEFPYEIVFMEQRGHLLTLKLPHEMDEGNDARTWDALPFFPEDHGGWQYKVITEKKQKNFNGKTAQERYSEIEKEIKTGCFDSIIHAGDPDQEGELLVDLVLKHAGNTLPVERFWTNAQTEGAILDALKNLRDADHEPFLINLLKAGYGRQHSDYRFGMNLSSAASLQMQGRAAIGRVKTVYLKIICDREDEIENFVPSTTYGVKIIYDNGTEGVLFIPTTNAPKDEIEEDEGENSSGIVWFNNKQEALDVISQLHGAAIVETYEQRETKTNPPKLFKLSSAQVEAGKIGFDAMRTLEIIQALYDKGYLSYPRTGCELLASGEDLNAFLQSASCIPELAPFVSNITDADIERVRGNKRWVDDEAIKEEGHTGLRPTESAPDYQALNEDEKKIYKMICTQYVSIFLPPLIQQKIRMVAKLGDHYFVTTGKHLVSAGFTEIFGTVITDKDIPLLNPGDSLPMVGGTCTEKTTTCPVRFTTSTLIAASENPAKFLNDESLKYLGKRLRIGTDATRAPIIQRLIEVDNYLAISKNKKMDYLVPTPVGRTIIRNLGDCAICRVDMTAHWEEQLDMVRKGTLSLDELEQTMRIQVEQMIDEIKSKPMEPIQNLTSSEVGECPVCRHPVISGKKSFFCSDYKNGCQFARTKTLLGARISDKEFASLLRGGEIEKMLEKDGKKWKQKLRLDHDGYMFVREEKVTTNFNCPHCGGLILKSSLGYICEKYSRNDNGCKFSIPNKICGYAMQETDINAIIANGQTGILHGLISKTQKTFDALLVMQEDGSLKMEFPKPTASSYQCPVCGGTLMVSAYGYTCSNHKDDPESCPFTGIPAQLCGCTITEADVKELLAGNQTRKFTGLVSKKGKQFDAALKLENNSLSFVFDTASAPKPCAYPCPCCGKGMEERDTMIRCTCGFVLWKTVAKKTLAESDIRDLLRNGSTNGPVYGFRSKKGNKFSARLWVNKNEKKIAFDFGE